MTPIWVGTIIVPMQTASSTLLPRKRSLAKAKPASVHRPTVPRVIQPATTTELIRPLFSGASCSALCTLEKNEPLGSSGGVEDAISALVCDAITIV
jgi:hypothetical protein